MKGRSKKGPREKDLTERFLSGGFEGDADQPAENERFSARTGKLAQQAKMQRTTAMRAADVDLVADAQTLPIGEVAQVYSRFIQVEHETGTRICVVRKTLTKTSDSSIVVGDRVRFRDSGTISDDGRPEAVIEQVLPRKSLLTRSDSFNSRRQHPIVANADRMLVVASVVKPLVKWGLVDRMIVAALAGKLEPVICLNKIDLAGADAEAAEQLATARDRLAHYASLGIVSIETSAELALGFDLIRDTLRNRTTVLAGHSGVGKSSLITAIQPGLDIRVGEVSQFTAKGRHTTTSARRYLLEMGGYVIDTPGVKVFGLWNVTRENLKEYFPDIEAGTAPPWRRESFERIEASLPD